MEKKKALITGITGQDGSYLAELLLEKDYEVFGMYRRSSVDSHHERIAHIASKINLVCGDLTDYCSLEKIIKNVKPDEVYNLAAQSQVKVSFDQPILTKEINWLGVERLLDLTKEYTPQAKIYQASTSEMFGNVGESPQDENTPLKPVSPYGEAKVKAYNAIRRERENGLFGCNGILFNHESPRRGIEFVTRKISDGISRIKLGLPQRDTGKEYIELGNIDAKRDWGFAGDYVKAIWLMLQQSKPDDYIIATGETHSVREFIEYAFNFLDMPLKWEGKELEEVGKLNNGKIVIKINPQFFRPTELYELNGNASKAKRYLGWSPETKFKDLTEMMIKSDLKKLR